MHATFRDYPKYFELIDGRRYAKVSPQRTHALLQGWLLLKLRELACDRGEVGSEWKFYLGGAPGLKNALQPDVSFVSYDRLRPLTPAQRETPGFSPDVAIEIRSPDDRPKLLKQKITRYLKKGAIVVVEVNPVTRTVVAHATKGQDTFVNGDTFAIAEVPWLTFEVSELFAAADWRG